MDIKEFNSIIRPKNVKYRDMFGYIPTINEYSCTREQFIKAMDDAIQENREIQNYIPKYGAFADREMEVQCAIIFQLGNCETQKTRSQS